MKRPALCLAFLIFNLSFLISSLANAQSPVITTFSPASGAIGSSVTITGTGFSATANQDIVFFGATQAAVTAAGATSLTVTVPVGATYQYISVTNLAVNLTAYSAQPFIVTLAGNIAFANKQDFTTGTNPFSLGIGDIDGDGKPDLAVANNGSNTVSVIRSTSTSGTVSFAAKVDLTTGTQPYSVSIGDIDGDGKPDLAVANFSSNTVSVLRNTSTSGTVSFASKVDLTTGTQPYSVSIGDIDGDGKPDLAVANESSNSVSVIRNTSTSGIISFASKVDLTTGTGPVSVSIGDIDGDGKPDLAVANYNSNNVSIIRNTSVSGTVSFASKVDLTTGAGPYSVSIGDIDGDGKSDWAVANLGSNTVSVFRSTSTPGNLSFAASADFVTGTSPYSVSIGDIDGDGKPDLAVANLGSNTVSVFHSTSASGTVNFASKVDFTTGLQPYSVSIGDIDGDGKPDLAVAYNGGNTISVLQQSTAITITSFSPASGVIGSSVTITGTGFSTTANQDIVFFGATQATVTAASTTSLTVTVPTGATYQYISVTNLAINLTAYSDQPFIITLAGNIAFADKQDFTIGGQPYLVSIEDIDGDGKSDLAVANGSSNTVSVIRNTSTSGIISFAAKVDLATGTAPESASIGDIDGDGKPDLVVPNNGSNTVSVIRNTSTSGIISFAAKVDLATGANPTHPVSIDDIDGDGKPDLAVANWSSNTVSVIRNTSTSGNLSFAAKVDLTTGTNPVFVSIGDIDGDGKPDLAVVNYNSSTVSVLRNTSASGIVSFAAKVDFTTGTNPYSVSIGDIDGDGKADLVVANNGSNTISVIRNTSTSGTVSFAAKVDFTTGAAPLSVSIGDIDGDGKPDLAAANSGSNTVSVIRNTSTSGTVSFASKVDFITGASPYSVSIGDIDGDGKPDLAVTDQGNNTVSVIRQEDLPQGSLTANGPLCSSGTGQLTWTATSGTGLFTVVYNDGTADQTAANVSSGVPFNVFTNPVTNTTTYTLVSVTYPNNATRTSGFTGPSATITVNTPPNFTCPVDQTANTSAGSCTAAVSYSATSVTGSPAPTFTYSFGGATTGSGSGTGSGSAFNQGVTEVILTASNTCGTPPTCSFSVTVTDNVNPTITAPANVNAATNAGCTATAVSLGTPVAADNCSVASVTNDAPSIFALGTTTVTWTVTDGNANKATATQTVTISDNINPTITAPSNVNATTNAGCTATAVSLGTPITADNCSVASVTNDAPSAFALGSTIVTWTVTDGSGNTATAAQTVMVTDNSNPTITAPVNVIVCNGSAIVLGTPATADNCSVASVANDAPGTYPLGNTTVTWTVTDGSGNTATATQTVTVNLLPDVTTNLSGAIVTANQTGASYQWLDCNNSNSPIAGAIGQSYTATANGDYAVVVTLSSCLDTSACVNVSVTGINETKNNDQLRVFPNPSNGVFAIRSTSAGVYSIMNELGQSVRSFKLDPADQYTVTIENLGNGIYFIVGFNNNRMAGKKIVVAK